MNEYEFITLALLGKDLYMGDLEKWSGKLAWGWRWEEVHKGRKGVRIGRELKKIKRKWDVT